MRYWFGKDRLCDTELTVQYDVPVTTLFPILSADNGDIREYGATHSTVPVVPFRDPPLFHTPIARLDPMMGRTELTIEIGTSLKLVSKDGNVKVPSSAGVI